jgi:predicted nuclease with TOPRIM domain
MGNINIYEMLGVLCDLRGITVEDFFELSTGITPQDRANYRNNVGPSVMFRVGLADFFGIPIEHVDSKECLERTREEIAKNKEMHVSIHELARMRGDINRIQRRLDRLEDEFNNGTNGKQLEMLKKYARSGEMDSIMEEVSRQRSRTEIN